MVFLKIPNVPLGTFFAETVTYTYTHLHMWTHTHSHRSTHMSKVWAIHEQIYTQWHTEWHNDTHTYTQNNMSKCTDNGTHTLAHVYAHAHTHQHTHTYTYSLTHALTHTCTRADKNVYTQLMCTQWYIHIYIHTCILECSHTYTHRHIHTCAHTYIHTHACTHIRTCMYAHMHIYKQTQRLTHADTDTLKGGITDLPIVLLPRTFYCWLQLLLTCTASVSRHPLLYVEYKHAINNLSHNSPNSLASVRWSNFTVCFS